MSQSIMVDVIYGFQCQVELTDEEMDQLYELDIRASPVVYTTQDSTDTYIIGKSVARLTSAGSNRSFDFSETQKQEVQSTLFKKLNENGFDVSERPCSMIVNTYYG